MVHVMQRRQIFPQYQHDALFYFTTLKKEYDRALATLHSFTKRVIAEKRQQSEADSLNDQAEEAESSAPKGRIAFLDLLLKATLPDGSKLQDDDIQEEVDTFMFEGKKKNHLTINFEKDLIFIS